MSDPSGRPGQWADFAMCAGLLLIAATLTVLTPGSIFSYRQGSHWYFPNAEEIRWMRFAGAAIAVAGLYLRLRYKR